MYQQNDTDMTTTMIATNNALTITRMTVIAKRTGSELMAGAKGMMIENLKKQMRRSSSSEASPRVSHAG